MKLCLAASGLLRACSEGVRSEYHFVPISPAGGDIIIESGTGIEARSESPSTQIETGSRMIQNQERHKSVSKTGPVDFHTTESVVTVDWENGFVEASAKDNTNVSQIFKELLVQAKVKYNLSPALRRKRRQSLPTGPQGAPGAPPAPHVPSPAQLAHLQQIRGEAFRV
ncbi:hypothetical protein EVAR_48593_1 [Eumeta japonica]|uniref:Uncharacterized protein n=1 Tax=Eumeta variegata TaxID=151549 RepID=A0A4C1Z0U8_EUMVA|nr:hypothetical protein EVAR_48593_1 [Eumeta japonica]